MAWKSLDAPKDALDTNEIKEDLSTLKGDVEAFIPACVNDPNIYESYLKGINDMNEDDRSETKVILNHIPENERPYYIMRAANVSKNFNGISPKQSLRYLSSSKFYLKVLEDTERFYLHDILETIYDVIDEWKNPFDGILTETKFTNEKINKCIEDNNGILYIDKLPSEIQKEILNWIAIKCSDSLFDRILDFLQKDPDTVPELLLNNDEFLKFYVNLYNISHHGKHLLNYESLSENDKKILQEAFNVELCSLNFKTTNVNADLLKEKEERDRLIREENQRILEEYKKKNEELNAGLQWKDPVTTNESIGSKPSGEKLGDNTSWLEIAEGAWLWKQLVEQYNSEYQEESQYDEQAISIAWSKFINTHKELQSIITEEIFLELYNASSNTIKNFDDEARDWLKEIFKDQPEELENLYKQISSLPSIITETKEELHKNSDFAKAVQNENNNNVALGSVIDNVKNIFSNISWKIEWDLWNKWFKFNDNDPAKIQWDNLMISWDFNWAEVLVRYNLKSWEIFMNSFLQFQEDSKKIILWNDEVANYKVWQLESFDNMLSNHESLNSQVNLLSNAIVESSKKQSAINSIVVNFMKTFNVIADPQNIENIEINNWSDLFDFLEIISNSNPNDLEIFQTAMRKLMEYSWLDRGKDNSDGPQENDKTDVENEYASTLRDSIKVFTENPGIFKDKTNFESSYKFWFLQMVIENFKKDGIGKPNRELDGVKINEFMYNLENLGRVS